MNTPATNGRRVVATYDYLDEAGVLLFQTVRYEPKDFRQRRPDGTGDWLWNLGGIQPILFRLPQLLRASPGLPVFVVEGEKDVLALERVGLVATCNPMGAGKWRPSYNEAFRDRHVVILPDNDEPGRRHAAQVVAALRGVAASVKVLSLPGLPAKGDVSDWLAQGGTGTQLLELAATAPEARAGPATRDVAAVLTRQLAVIESCTHDELLNADLPPLRWLVEGLLPEEGLTILGGKKKLGKSWLCLQLTQAIALGVPCLGRPTVQGPVAYLCLEDGKRRLKQRLQKQQAAPGLPVVYYTRHPPLDGPGLGQLLELIDRHRPRLLILDTLAACKTGKTDENAAGPMADLGNALRAVAQQCHLGVLTTHHHGKGVGGDPGDDLRGSSALAAAADVNLGMYKDDAVYTLRGEGRDIEAFSHRIQFDRRDTWAWQLVGDARDLAQQEADAAILEALGVLQEADAATVAAEVQRDRSRVADRLLRLKQAGILTSRSLEPRGRGRPRILYQLKDLDQDDPFG
jgi:hypothetical protein